MIWLAFVCGLVLGAPAGILIHAWCVGAARADEAMVAEVYRRRLAEVLAAQGWVHRRHVGVGRDRPDLN